MNLNRHCEIDEPARKYQFPHLVKPTKSPPQQWRSQVDDARKPAMRTLLEWLDTFLNSNRRLYFICGNTPLEIHTRHELSRFPYCSPMKHDVVKLITEILAHDDSKYALYWPATFSHHAFIAVGRPTSMFFGKDSQCIVIWSLSASCLLPVSPADDQTSARLSSAAN